MSYFSIFGGFQLHSSILNPSEKLVIGQLSVIGQMFWCSNEPRSPESGRQRSLDGPLGPGPGAQRLPGSQQH